MVLRDNADELALMAQTTGAAGEASAQVADSSGRCGCSWRPCKGMSPD